MTPPRLNPSIEVFIYMDVIAELHMDFRLEDDYDVEAADWHPDNYVAKYPARFRVRTLEEAIDLVGDELVAETADLAEVADHDFKREVTEFFVACAAEAENHPDEPFTVRKLLEILQQMGNKIVMSENRL